MTPTSADPDDPAAAELQRLSQQGQCLRLGPAGQGLLWRRFGAGPPLLLLHGGHGSGWHWARNIEALAADHEVLVPDMPSFGESADLPGAPHDGDRLERLVQALQAGLTELLPRPVAIDLVGFSFGGLVAAHLAAHLAVSSGTSLATSLATPSAAHPRNADDHNTVVEPGTVTRSLHLVRRLALIGPAGHGTRRRTTVPLLDWRVPDPAARRAALLQNLQSFMFHRAGSADALALHIHEQACMATRFRSKALSMRSDLMPALQVWGGPLLALWGEHDVTCVPVELGPWMAGQLPGMQWQVLPEAGHWLAYEEAPAVNQRLLAWFGAA